MFRKYLHFLYISVIIAVLILNYCFRLYSTNFHKSSTGDISVMCYNIHSSGPNFGTDAPDIAKLIIANNSDFVYLTEYYEVKGDTIDTILRNNYPYAYTKQRWGMNEGDAFYSRWEIDSVFRYNVDGHFCSMCRIQVHKDIDTITLYCCHLSSNNLKLNEGRWASLKEGRLLRLIEMDTIVNALQREKYPCVIMGDMNDVSGSKPMNKLEGAGFEDAWWNGGWGYGGTFHSGWLNLRIDHVLYDNHFQLTDIRVLHADYSDHDALAGSFIIKRK